MKIIVVGAGRIGANLAKALSEEDHEVYLIETDEENARKASEHLDVKVIFGSGTDPEVMKQAQADQADLVIAVTLSDETNLAASSLASFLGSKRQIARVRDIALADEISKNGFEHFNINEIINPEELAARAIVRAIETPGASEVGDFAEGRIFLRTFDVPSRSPLCGVAIGDFRDEDFPWPFLVVAIRRDEEVVIPKGDTTIKEGDRIYVLLPSQSLGEFLMFVDPNTKAPKKVVIYGASKTGEYVARALCGNIKYLVFLEEDPIKAEGLAGRLDAVRVIQGSGSEKDVLKESGIEVADVFIATSPSDHSNLISAVLAKKMGAGSTIITTHRPDYMAIVDALDIDAVISPHLLAVDNILATVRGKNVSAVTKLMDCDAEALEFIPEENSPVTKAPIKKISFPKNAIVGAVCKQDEVALATGDTQIFPGEKVIVFCKDSAVKKLQQLFTSS